jgi:hypothetical protein
MLMIHEQLPLWTLVHHFDGIALHLDNDRFVGCVASQCEYIEGSLICMMFYYEVAVPRPCKRHHVMAIRHYALWVSDSHRKQMRQTRHELHINEVIDIRYTV